MGLPLGGATVEGVTYEVGLPSWVAIDLTARLTNGGVVATGFEMGSVDIETTNGEVVLAGGARDVHVETDNGGITAVLAPSASGAFDISTTNGQVQLTVPEGRSRGYDIHAQTTNGNIEILLTDGTTDVQDGPASHEGSFKTRSFESRAIQTTMTLSTTNGQVAVVPG